MILSDLIVAQLINYKSDFLSPDTLEDCINKTHFKNYPFEIYYDFNSRGFRDSEWPDDVKNSIWCVGDSATLGIGCPLSHTWPYLLADSTGKKTINISARGVGNYWIAKKSLRILNEVGPSTMVIQWSYVHRREFTVLEAFNKRWPAFYQQIRGRDWPKHIEFKNYHNLPQWIREEIETIHIHNFKINDLDRIGKMPKKTTTREQEIAETVRLIQKIERKKGSTKVIHCHIPDSGYDGSLTKNFADIGQVQILDYARDGYHFDIKSSQNLVGRMLPYL